MTTSTFWLQAIERAAKTAAQVALVMLVLGDDIGFNVLAVDWTGVLASAAGGAIASLLTSIVSAPVGAANSPSLVPVRDQG